jgi:hypothetical protein
MNKQMATIGRKLAAADMKKMLGGAPGVGGSGTGQRCAQVDPCMGEYIPGGEGCCRTCCTRACLAAQQADPTCWYV